jgi:hypothetical protein
VDEEDQEPTDRAYWEKRGTKATVGMADDLLEIDNPEKVMSPTERWRASKHPADVSSKALKAFPTTSRGVYLPTSCRSQRCPGLPVSDPANLFGLGNRIEVARGLLFFPAVQFVGRFAYDPD